jgi:hypothetical protein
MPKAPNASTKLTAGAPVDKASDLVERLEDLIDQWESALDDDAVVETKVLLSGKEIAVTKLGYQDPRLVIVVGRDTKGHEVLAAIPRSQFVVTCTARSVKDIAKDKPAGQADHVRNFDVPRVRVGGV